MISEAIDGRHDAIGDGVYVIRNYPQDRPGHHYITLSTNRIRMDGETLRRMVRIGYTLGAAFIKADTHHI